MDSPVCKIPNSFQPDVSPARFQPESRQSGIFGPEDRFDLPRLGLGQSPKLISKADATFRPIRQFAG
jgi:hypothetical protein